MKKDTILINGKEAMLEYRQSRSHQKDDPKLNTLKVHRVLEELLKENREIQSDKGINTLNTFTNLDGGKNWNDTRPSNAIVQLRKVIPKSGLLTFRYLNEKEWRYGLINDEAVISFADDLLANIKSELSLKL